MRVGNDHHTRGNGTESHDYCETVEVKYCKSSKDPFALAFRSSSSRKCVFLVVCQVGDGLVMNGKLR